MSGPKQYTLHFHGGPLDGQTKSKWPFKPDRFGYRESLDPKSKPPDKLGKQNYYEHRSVNDDVVEMFLEAPNDLPNS